MGYAQSSGELTPHHDRVYGRYIPNRTDMPPQNGNRLFNPGNQSNHLRLCKGV